MVSHYRESLGAISSQTPMEAESLVRQWPGVIQGQVEARLDESPLPLAEPLVVSPIIELCSALLNIH